MNPGQPTRLRTYWLPSMQRLRYDRELRFRFSHLLKCGAAFCPEGRFPAFTGILSGKDLIGFPLWNQRLEPVHFGLILQPLVIKLSRPLLWRVEQVL